MLKEAHDGSFADDLLDQIVALEGTPRDRRLREYELLYRHLEVTGQNMARCVKNMLKHVKTC